MPDSLCYVEQPSVIFSILIHITHKSTFTSNSKKIYESIIFVQLFIRLHLTSAKKFQVVGYDEIRVWAQTLEVWINFVRSLRRRLWEDFLDRISREQVFMKKIVKHSCQRSSHREKIKNNEKKMNPLILVPSPSHPLTVFLMTQQCNLFSEAIEENGNLSFSLESKCFVPCVSILIIRPL